MFVVDLKFIIIGHFAEAMSGMGNPTPTPGPTTTPSDPTDPPTGPTEPTDSPTTTPPDSSTTTTPPGEADWRQTVIYMYAASQPGQDLFFRGGIDADRRPGNTTSLLEHSITQLDITSVILAHWLSCKNQLAFPVR